MGHQDWEATIKPTARVNFGALDEVSGIVRSQTYPGGFWAHNDSGDSARFFCIRRDGTVVRSSDSKYKGIAVEGATNVDWEDIAQDGDRLFLCDVGNNGNERRDLKIYEVRQPNPTRVTSVRPEKVYSVAYPDQKDFPPRGVRPFDCEAVFCLRGKLYFVTKHRQNALMPDVSANLYRMDTRFTDRVNVLTKLDSKSDVGGWVTGADASPDGRKIAVLVQAPSQGVWIFDARAKGDRFLSSPGARFIRFTGAKQCEGVAFIDDRTLMVTNEQRDIFEIKL